MVDEILMFGVWTEEGLTLKVYLSWKIWALVNETVIRSQTWRAPLKIQTVSSLYKGSGRRIPFSLLKSFFLLVDKIKTCVAKEQKNSTAAWKFLYGSRINTRKQRKLAWRGNSSLCPTWWWPQRIGFLYALGGTRVTKTHATQAFFKSPFFCFWCYCVDFCSPPDLYPPSLTVGT